ncbi:hypothetical protein CYMTET_13119 [Cymbomonas tetramitiformis]|uniref:Transmembrane protein 131-like N-terminal domain-containing protein n=1 Tax=Cymbomonas tetramitiformis TaxID=36881 RepID=A0AAE0GKB0_9CHLO|nr:hypothetical protein CYMTET_13119 [Cymbomonas tetramitiformis]
MWLLLAVSVHPENVLAPSPDLASTGSHEPSSIQWGGSSEGSLSDLGNIHQNWVAAGGDSSGNSAKVPGKSSSKSERKKASPDLPAAGTSAFSSTEGSQEVLAASSLPTQNNVPSPPSFSGPTSSAPNVSIIPPFMDWKERPLCSPSASTLDIVNTADMSELLILSLSTDNIQYYPSNFRQTSVPPGGKASISIVYLPRTLGPVDGTMIIQTSVGGFLIQMHGQGVPSPYEAQPLLGAKVPAGVKYGYSLELHNPFDEMLKVKEVYTNEDFLRLSLPQTPAAQNGPARLWEIGPHETKSIINLEFMSHTPGKYLGLVHVKTLRDTIIMPVDIHAIKGGIYRNPEEIDFGTLTTVDERQYRTISLLNSGSSAIAVVDAHPAILDPSLLVSFIRGVVLPPGEETEVATVTYVGSVQGRVASKLLLRTNDTTVMNGRVEIPFKARVLHGSLGFPTANTTFEARGPPFTPVVQHLRLTNYFSVPLVFYSAKVNDRNFEVLEFSSGVTVGPSEAVPLISIRFLANTSSLMYDTALLLSTNVSQLQIPLYVYHGRLLYSLPDTSKESVLTVVPTLPQTSSVAEAVEKDGGVGAKAADGLDFGVLGVGETRTQFFNLTNPNPVPVHIYSVSSSLPAATVSLTGVWDKNGILLRLPDTDGHAISGDMPEGEGKEAGGSLTEQAPEAAASAGEASKSAASRKTNAYLMSDNLVDGEADGLTDGGVMMVLEPGHSALFEVVLLSEEEEERVGEINIHTPYEELSIRVLYESVQGTLQVTPSVVRFDSVFPGKVLRKPLWAWSTYNRPLTISSVASSDARMVPELEEVILPPNKRVQIGQLAFDTSRVAAEENYLSDATFAGHAGLSQPSGALTRLDVQALKRRELVWEAVVARGLTDVRASLTVHTDIVRGVTLTAQGTLGRPTVLSVSELNFSLAQVGTEVSQDVTIYNPSDHPLAVRLLPLPMPENSPEGMAAMEAFPQSIPADGEGGGGWADALGPPVALINQLPSSVWLDSSDTGTSEDRAFWLRGQGAKEQIVPPHSEAIVGPVHFAPTSLKAHYGVLYVKNNLTLLQALPLFGYGGSGSLRFEHANGSLQELAFAVKASHLGFTDVEREDPWSTSAAPRRSDGQTWPVVVRKRFRAVNRGNLPVQVHGMGIGTGGGCTGYGFTVEDCSSTTLLSLKPGQATHISISYQPDFSASEVRHELLVTTSAGTHSFPLVARLPHHLLPACLAAVPVGPMEVMVHRGCMLLMLALLIFFARILLSDFASYLKRPAPAGAGVTPEAPETATAASAEPVRSPASTSSTIKREVPIGTAELAPGSKAEAKSTGEEAEAQARGGETKPVGSQASVPVVRTKDTKAVEVEAEGDRHVPSSPSSVSEFSTASVSPTATSAAAAKPVEQSEVASTATSEPGKRYGGASALSSKADQTMSAPAAVSTGLKEGGKAAPAATGKPPASPVRANVAGEASSDVATGEKSDKSSRRKKRRGGASAVGAEGQAQAATIPGLPPTPSSAAAQRRSMEAETVPAAMPRGMSPPASPGTPFHSANTTPNTTPKPTVAALASAVAASMKDPAAPPLNGNPTATAMRPQPSTAAGTDVKKGGKRAALAATLTPLQTSFVQEGGAKRPGAPNSAPAGSNVQPMRTAASITPTGGTPQVAGGGRKLYPSGQPPAGGRGAPVSSSPGAHMGPLPKVQNPRKVSSEMMRPNVPPPAPPPGPPPRNATMHASSGQAGMRPGMSSGGEMPQHPLPSFWGMDDNRGAGLNPMQNPPLPPQPPPNRIQPAVPPPQLPHGRPGMVGLQSAFGGDPLLSSAGTGIRDTLSSFGSARLDAQGELGSHLYNIWGDKFSGTGAGAGGATSGFGGGLANPASTSAPPLPPTSIPPPGSEQHGEGSFFNFPSASSVALEPLEPASHQPGTTGAFASSIGGSAFGGFSMFSMPPSQPPGGRPAGRPVLRGLDPTWGPPPSSVGGAEGAGFFGGAFGGAGSRGTAASEGEGEAPWSVPHSEGSGNAPEPSE